MVQTLTERQACEDAQKLARQLGDEEWGKGETKYALEAYEASDITARELFEKALKLLEAAKIVQEWWNDELAAKHLSSFDHDGRFEYSSGKCDKCVRCRTLKALNQQYRERIRTLLDWDGGDYWHQQESSGYRAAAVACLKLIKRMFPE